MKFLFYFIALVIWAASFIWDVLPLGYSYTSPLWTRVTYIFTHIGFFHLALNILSADIMLYGLRRFIRPDLMLPIAFAGAMLATFGTEKTLPTIGASGVVYFLFGVFGAIRLNIRVLASIAVILSINIILSFYNVNTGIHIVSMAYGFIFGLILRIITGTRIKKIHTA